MHAISYDRTAPVFNIQSYCIHDGPGIRTTVFVKGCPLRCLWCANPESNAAYPELMTYSSRCTGCGRCVPVCPRGAISIREQEGKCIAYTDRGKCVNCGACVSACTHEAREIAGKQTTVREALDVVLQDRLFYEASGGGMTISGGEALAHPNFSADLFAAAQAEGLHTAIESSCFAPREVVDRVFPHVSLGLLDIKHMDSAIHKELTGAGNELILENIRKIDAFGIPITIRTPVIPGCNDSEENIRRTAAFIKTLGGVKEYELLHYHQFGVNKYKALGRVYPLGDVDTPSDEEIRRLVKCANEEFAGSGKICFYTKDNNREIVR